jgi:hypothetical protein
MIQTNKIFNGRCEMRCRKNLVINLVQSISCFPKLLMISYLVYEPLLVTFSSCNTVARSSIQRLLSEETTIKNLRDSTSRPHPSSFISADSVVLKIWILTFRLENKFPNSCKISVSPLNMKLWIDFRKIEHPRRTKLEQFGDFLRLI